MRTALMICMAMLGQGLLCQEVTPPKKTALSSEQKEAMVALIGVGRSLLEASNTGDQDLIPALRDYLGRSKPTLPGAQEARMALAKLGESRAQQKIVCEFYGNDKIVMQDAAQRELPYIGGWFSIRIYRYLLSPEADKRFWKAKKPETSDLGFISPALMAVMELPKVVANPPLRPGPDFLIRGDVEHDRDIWLNWIAENQASLMQLEPTGEGVDFSGKACANKSRELSVK